jgi:hypothetical protein
MRPLIVFDLRMECASSARKALRLSGIHRYPPLPDRRSNSRAKADSLKMLGKSHAGRTGPVHSRRKLLEIGHLAAG